MYYSMDLRLSFSITVDQLKSIDPRKDYRANLGPILDYVHTMPARFENDSVFVLLRLENVLKA